VDRLQSTNDLVRSKVDVLHKGYRVLGIKRVDNIVHDVGGFHILELTTSRKANRTSKN
jgi:hypothetical protein